MSEIVAILNGPHISARVDDYGSHLQVRFSRLGCIGTVTEFPFERPFSLGILEAQLEQVRYDLALRAYVERA